MKFLSAVVALFLLASSTAAAIDVRNCAKDTGTFKLTSLTLSPDQTETGKELCATLKGTLTKDIIKGAQIHVNGNVVGTPFSFNQDLDLCDAVENSCPVHAATATELTYCKTLDVSGFTADLKVEANNADGTSIFCFEGRVAV